MIAQYSLLSILIWVVVPAINFYTWRQYAKNKSICPVIPPQPPPVNNQALSSQTKCIEDPTPYDECASIPSNRYPHLELMNSVEFDKTQLSRPENLAENVVYVMDNKNTIIVHRNRDEPCTRYVTHTSGTIVGKFCFAAVFYEDKQIKFTYNLVRHDKNIDEAGQVIEPDYNYKLLDKMKNQLSSTMITLKSKLFGKYLKLNKHNLNKLRPTGFFRKTPPRESRDRLQEKLEIFLGNFNNGDNSIVGQLRAKLSANNIKKGDDLITMVVNEGEIDLYMNFACSCQLHKLSLHNLIVFVGSPEIVKVIESTGAMALYNEGYGVVSKKASNDYLDRVFVDMMWYKAFSIFLILREGINVLFQDVDLVWFRNPFPYFHDYIAQHKERSNMTGAHPEAFFSDDGQRTHRYTPYFANSGFYYLLSTPRSINFAWSIMTAFTIIHAGGSHQNVFTMRLLEGLGVTYPQTKILSIPDFPGGMMFHHNEAYMEKILTREVQPYHFHMCWTGGKPDKLKYFRQAKMWYLTTKCSPLESLIPKGAVYKQIKDTSDSLAIKPFDWNLEKKCCVMPKGGV